MKYRVNKDFDYFGRYFVKDSIYNVIDYTHSHAILKLEDISVYVNKDVFHENFTSIKQHRNNILEKI